MTAHEEESALALAHEGRPDLIVLVVDVHVAALRRKLEDDPSQPRWVRTIRGLATSSRTLQPRVPLQVR